MFVIGKIVNTQGVRGEMRVMPSTDDPERFSMLSEVTLRNERGMKKYTLERAWPHKQFVVIKLVGIDDMTAAEKLKWHEILIEDSQALPLSEDEYYARDLYGMAVITAAGEELGTISDIMSTGANDVYIVKNTSGGELLIPAIKHVVVNVDLGARIITVVLPEGLR